MFMWNVADHLASVHFHHLESAQSLRLVFNLLPQLVSLLFKAFGRRMWWFGTGSRKLLTPWCLFISVYINTGHDQWRVINHVPGICWNLSAIILLLINTKAFGHRERRGEGAPCSLQPLLQRGAQLLMMLRKSQWMNDRAQRAVLT